MGPHGNSVLGIYVSRCTNHITQIAEHDVYVFYKGGVLKSYLKIRMGGLPNF